MVLYEFYISLGEMGGKPGLHHVTDSEERSDSLCAVTDN
jgi:hypothetical protein